jgi:L-aminopeptidase/D-esterase-like protein
MTMVSNDHLSLTPQTRFDTPVLEFDFPGLEIGIAEYDEGPTGCTVFYFPNGVRTAVDPRGGMIGMTDANDWCSAICFAGGSLMGLEATAGAGAEIFARKGHNLDGQPVMNGAIIYDYGRRDNRIYPDKALGRAAVKAAGPGIFPLGARGAGRSAGAGAVFGTDWHEPSGQGGAFRQIGEVKIAVFTVVNALGAVHDRNGKVVRGNRNPATGERVNNIPELERRLAKQADTQPRPQNTTLTVVATNLKLSTHWLTQLGRQVHSSMARAIQPFHSIYDGDVLFAVTTDAVESDLHITTLGLIASELAWDAILASAPA